MKQPDEDAATMAPEPPEATHQAEDETWDTGGEDAPHRLDAADELTAQVAELEAEVAAAKDRTLRAQADYQNLVRRTDEERAQNDARAAARVIGRLLDAYEALARAVADLDAAGVAPDDPRAKGVRLAYDGLDQALCAEGLEPVPGVGEPFDHRVHEAIAREPSEHPADTVAEVIRAGYRLHGKLLREALVKVSSGPE